MKLEDNMAQRPEAAPQLNEDILHELMHLLTTKERGCAALVCRGWTSCAQHALYRTLTYCVHRASPSAHRTSPEWKLERTLREQAHLRPLVRQVVVNASQDVVGRLDWLRLFPAHSLRNVTFVAWPRAAFSDAGLAHLLDEFPAVRAPSPT